MSRKATPITLTVEEKRTLKQWVSAAKTKKRLVIRSRIILLAAQGVTTRAIARKLKVRPATVSKWRIRFAKDGLSGLQDAPRPGARKRYDERTEERILAMLDQKPPSAYRTWTAELLAEAIGGVSKHHVWRVLSRHGIHLQRRRSWYISTDSELAPKAVDIVGLFLDPPENAVVLCVDEEPHSQVLESAQGWLRVPNSKALTGLSHGNKRHGTTTLCDACIRAKWQVGVGHYESRRRREFLDFMDEVIADYADLEIRVILDRLRMHKPERTQWLARHPNVHFDYAPSYESWLNQVQIWFSILSRRDLKGASFTSALEVRNAVAQFIAGHNKKAAPFEWRKRQVHPLRPKRKLR